MYDYPLDENTLEIGNDYDRMSQGIINKIVSESWTDFCDMESIEMEDKNKFYEI
jgi:hypothetical protein